MTNLKLLICRIKKQMLKHIRALDKVLKYTGFEKMDKIAKQTLVNSAVRKARADAKAESPELEAYLRHEFGEKWVDVKEDLKTGAVTDEIMEYRIYLC